MRGMETFHYVVCTRFIVSYCQLSGPMRLLVIHCRSISYRSPAVDGESSVNVVLMSVKPPIISAAGRRDNDIR